MIKLMKMVNCDNWGYSISPGSCWSVGIDALRFGRDVQGFVGISKFVSSFGLLGFDPLNYSLLWLSLRVERVEIGWNIGLIRV